MKSLKILVISSKGGVGKSTVSMQVVAPYLYEKNEKNPINFYEFDDENIDSLSYGASLLTNREAIAVEQYIMIEKMIEILTQEHFCCIDVGGNKSTSLCIDVLEESGLVNEIDCAIIPLLDGEQDAINAKNIYIRLKSLSPSLKVIFALNRVKNRKFVNYEFDNFFGDARGIFDDSNALIHFIKGDEDNYICIEDSDTIKYSRKFGLTIYEIASQKRDFNAMLQNSKDDKDKKMIAFKNYVYQNSKKYYLETLKPTFLKLDTFFKE